MATGVTQGPAQSSPKPGLLASPVQWLRQLMQQSYLGKWTVVGILIGIVAGVGATAFYLGIEAFTNLMLGGIAGYFPPNPAGESAAPLSSHPDFLIVPLVVVLGGLVTGILVYTLAPEAEGHGTDEAIAAFHKRDGKIRRRIPLVKAAASMVTLGSGGSGGREGPTAQIAAGFGSMVAELLHLSVKDRRTAVAVGIGAGIGTIFKAPFAGAILGGEILYSGGDFEAEALVPAFIAAPTGYLIFASIIGFTPIFGYIAPNVFTNIATLPVYLVLGGACGLAGRAYSVMFYSVKSFFGGLHVSRYFRPALGAAVTGLIAVFFPQVLGLGYGFLQFLVNGNLSAVATNYIGFPLLLTLLLIVVLKIVATSFTVGSGGSAGVFAPSLVIGGFLGAALWVIVDGVAPGWIPTATPLVIVGMMALFGGVGRAPIAVMLMVSEMTGSLSLLVPAVIAVLVSYFVVTPKFTIYKSQLQNRSASPAHLGEYSVPLLTRIVVADAMNTGIYSVSPEDSSDIAYRAIMDGRSGAVPVVDPAKGIVGIITMTDLRRVPSEKRLSTRVDDIMTKNVVVASRDENLLSAMNKLVTNEVEQLPVVDPGTGALVGMLTMKDAVRAYDKVVEWGAGPGPAATEA